MRRHGPSCLPVGPVMLESCWRGLFGAAFRTATESKRCGRVPGQPVSYSRRLGGAVVSFKFVVASRSESLRSRVFCRWPSVVSARDNAVCRAAPVGALFGSPA